MKKNNYLRKIALFPIVTILLQLFNLTTYAHSLKKWQKAYNYDTANTTYAFALLNNIHIDGNTVNFYWDSYDSETAVKASPDFVAVAFWLNIIHAMSTDASNAHIKLSYDSKKQPKNVAAITRLHTTTLFHDHIRKGKNDAEIIFYKLCIDKSSDYQYHVMGHELGHLWGLGDIYHNKTNLNSIYSDLSIFFPTRHDKNGLRIGLNNLWYEPVQGAWWYQPKPDEWHLRGDVVGNDDAITSADARQILRFSAKLDAATNLQLILSDVDGDGTVTAADARFVQQYAAKIITNFPADHD